MKYILTTLAALFINCCIFAQAPQISYSTALEEPDEMGWNKILQLKNGNTFYFHWVKKEGIGVTVFNKDRKLVSNKVFNGNGWDAYEMNIMKVCALFEAEGKPVIIVQQLLDRVPSLFRVVLNPETGEKTEDILISKLPRLQAGYIFATSWGGVNPPAFHVEKDPYSNRYAIINFNSFAKESDERIEAIVYDVENGTHKEVARSNYDAQGFKYMRFVSMAFDNKQRLFVCAYAFNTENSGGKDSRLIVSRMAREEKNFTYKQLEFTDDFKDTKGLMKFNPGTGLMQVMTLTYLTAKKSYFSGKVSTSYMLLMSYIDPESLFLVGIKPFSGIYAATYMKEHFDNDKASLGMPMDMILNTDNTTTIVHEEMNKLLTPKGFSSEMLTVNCTVGNIGISVLDEKGAETEGYAINKKQTAIGDIAAFGVSNIHKGFWSYNESTRRINAPFFSFDCINTPSGTYIIFNEFPENFIKPDNKRRNAVDKATTSSAVCYKYKNMKIDRFYLFGTPNDDDDNKFSYIQSGHYDKESNTYATLIIDHHGRDKFAKIAWVKFH